MKKASFTLVGVTVKENPPLPGPASKLMALGSLGFPLVLIYSGRSASENPLFEIVVEQDCAPVRRCAIGDSDARVLGYVAVLIVGHDHPTPVAVHVYKVVDLRVILIQRRRSGVLVIRAQHFRLATKVNVFAALMATAADPENDV